MECGSWHDEVGPDSLAGGATDGCEERHDGYGVGVDRMICR